MTPHTKDSKRLARNRAIVAMHAELGLGIARIARIEGLSRMQVYRIVWAGRARGNRAR